MNEERFVSEGFELLIRLPGRTRVPRNWMIITEGCEQRSTSTQHGMMLSVRSPLEAEIDRVFDALLKQPWAGEIADTWSRAYRVLEVLTPRQGRSVLKESSAQLQMPFHIARGIVPELAPPAVSLLTDGAGLLLANERYVAGYNDREEEDDGA